MNTTTHHRTAWRFAALACGLTLSAHAGLLVNGGFESGLTGWTTADQIGSEGTFALQTGTLSPVNGLPVPPPPAGLTAAMTDAAGPGSHVLYQDIFVPSVVPAASLRFALFLQNTAPAFYLPPTPHLDFATTDLNQQARVDILPASSDPFSTAPGDILLNLYQTMPGDPLVSGYTQVSVDVTALLQAHAGQTLRLRFAEVDNVDVFNLGVDAVDLRVIPEPAMAGLLGSLLCAGLVVWSRWGSRARTGGNRATLPTQRFPAPAGASPRCR